MRGVVALTIVVGTVAVALTVWAIWWLPAKLMTWPYFGVSVTPGGLSLSEVLEEQAAFRHSLVETAQTIAATVTAIVVVLTLYYTAKNVSIASRNAELALEAQRQARLGERFSKAIEQLGSGAEDVRVGAVYALSRIAKESVEDHWPVVELLCSYLRRHRPAGRQRAHGQVLPPEDVKAIAVFIRTRNYKREGPGQIIDLSRTNLHALDLEKAYLAGAILDGSELDGARLMGACLSGAKMAGVLAMDADFTGAWLDGAFLNGVDFSRARLSGADLNGASLAKAKANPVFGPVKNLTLAQRSSVDGEWNEV